MHLWHKSGSTVRYPSTRRRDRVSTPIVSVDSLVKRYGGTAVVDGLTFAVPEGIIFAILGPNGAGKTTTLECIEGVRRADEGTVEVLGLDPMRDSRKLMQSLGIQLQSQSLPSTMTVLDALTFFARYRGREPDIRIAERLGLASMMKKQYGTMSAGQQRRLSLSLCLQHAPRLVILDEPTAGLDVETRDEFHRLITEIKSEGVTVMLASHDMSEVEKLADRVIVLVRGKLAVAGSPREITAAGNSATRLTVSTAKQSVCRKRPVFDSAEIIAGDGEYVRFATHNPAVALKELLAWIDGQDDTIVDLRLERPTLEERFLEIVGGEKP